MWENQEEVQSTLLTLSRASSKGANLDVFLRYMKAMKATYTCLWSTYIPRKWAGQLLRLIGGS